MLQVYLIAIVVAMASGLSGFVYGTGVGADRTIAKQATLEKVAEKAALATANINADAISKITVTNKTIVQKATREVINNPVYRDCVNTDSMRDAINYALTGRGPDKSKLPTAGAAGGQQLRGNSPQADRRGEPVSNLPPVARPD